MPQDTTDRPSRTERVQAATLELPPWGRFSFAWSDAGICLIGLPDRAPGEHLGRLAARGLIVEGTSAPPENFRAALVAYFDGDPSALESLPIAQHGTEFQERAWSAMRKIPFGRTATYGAIAREAGATAAVRAVGNACSANLVAIAVPCHRVLAGDGTIGGFAAGVAWKQRLLQHELRVVARRNGTSDP